MTDITRPAIQQLDKEEQEETMKKQPSYSEASIIPNSFGPYIGTQLALICGSRQRRIKCERLNDPSVVPQHFTHWKHNLLMIYICPLERMGTRPGIKAQHYSQYSLTRPNDVNINSQGTLWTTRIVDKLSDSHL
ncbi:hypothetical protein PSTT_04497 [Puccinia striiformis]|uniref:Uncharacterized protein n=1 Tax=Puccinia striiformis TaxID=27350 RepID=A0A2S4VSI2_9BASI|nr:hypothetical protein PSTT_04497 [Puccinia striiformis]